MQLMTIIAATGNEAMDRALSSVKGFEVVDVARSKTDIMQVVGFYRPDILVVSEAIRGSQSLQKILFDVRSLYKDTRIIYLVGHVNMRDSAKVDALGYLVLAGIYDIVTGKKYNQELIAEILSKPKTLEDVEVYTKNIAGVKRDSSFIEFEDAKVDDEDDEDNLLKKINVVGSVKSGSGKTFLSVNIAIGIAVHGKNRFNSKKPKIALIEGDLQNLSIGTLLQQKEDPKKNLKTALDKISTLFNDDGELIARAGDIDEVNRFIKGCFKPYKHASNLHTITASSIKSSEFDNVRPEFYIYLIESILEDYDVIIVDTNSSLNHVSTKAVLYMANKCFYVLNLDFDNIRSNAREKSELKKIEAFDKIKYVLNEDMEEDCVVVGTNLESIAFTKEDLKKVGFDVIAEIPTVPRAVYMNRIYKGKPIILDDKDYTEKIRYEILKVCNEIWEIDGIDIMERKMIGLENDVKVERKKKTFFNKRR